jgi:hypothetical protein
MLSVANYLLLNRLIELVHRLGAEVASGYCPLIVLLLRKCAHQSEQGLPGGEDANHVATTETSLLSRSRESVDKSWRRMPGLDRGLRLPCTPTLAIAIVAQEKTPCLEAC